MNINATLLGQMITFLLFVWFTKKFVWPPMIRALKERQAKIADGLAAAERGHFELAKAQEEAQAALRTAKTQAANMLLEAQKNADQVVDASRREAHEEGARIIQQAKLEIANMIEEARESLRKQVAQVALVGAEKILQKSIDPTMHREMLEKLAQEI